VSTSDFEDATLYPFQQARLEHRAAATFLERTSAKVAASESLIMSAHVETRRKGRILTTSRLNYRTRLTRLWPVRLHPHRRSATRPRGILAALNARWMPESSSVRPGAQECSSIRTDKETT